MVTEFISCADTAKLIRRQLKAQFPGVKFSVRSHTYSGGASIDVGWTDGPKESRVESVVGVFAGGRFDGMIDLAYSVTSFLHEDGRASLACDGGTTGSRGSNPERLGDPLDGSAREVMFMADYVFTNRHISDDFAGRCASFGKPGGDLGWRPCDRCIGSCPQGGGFYVDRERGGFFVACSPECAGKLAARGLDAGDVLVLAAAVVDGRKS